MSQNQQAQKPQLTKEEQLVKRLQEQEQTINTLKVRLFDAEEQARSVTGTMDQFVGKLAQLFNLQGEDAQNLNNYISIAEQVVELANKQLATEHESLPEPEPKDGVTEAEFTEVVE